MQFRLSTDYALRIVGYIAKKGGIISSKEIAQNTGVSTNYTLKILRKLEQSKIVNSHRGVQGGYQLCQKPDKITLMDIICVMENTVKINSCLEENHYCSRKTVGTCSIHEFYKELQEQMENLMNEITIRKIIEREIGRVEVKRYNVEERCGKNVEEIDENNISGRIMPNVPA